MSRILRRTRAVLRTFDTSHDGLDVTRDDTKIVVAPDGRAEIRLFLKSKEVWGVWVMSYAITPKCLQRLMSEGLTEPHGRSAEGETFVLSAKGQQRLRQS